jgi:hypothetical protein
MDKTREEKNKNKKDAVPKSQDATHTHTHTHTHKRERERERISNFYPDQAMYAGRFWVAEEMDGSGMSSPIYLCMQKSLLRYRQASANHRRLEIMLKSDPNWSS